MTAISAKDAEIADLVQRLAVSSVATEAALANGDPTERQDLLNSHYFLGKDLANSRKALSDLQAAFTGAAAIAKSAMDALCTELAAKETALEAAQATLAQSQAELAPVLAENARLTEVVAQLTRENVAYGHQYILADYSQLLHQRYEPTTSVVDTNPEGIASSDTEPDSELTATQDGSASVRERPSLSVGTLQPLVAGLAGLGASSGAPTATPTHGTSSAPPRPTPPTQTVQPLNLEERSAAYKLDKQHRRRQHMGYHLIAAERVGQLQAETAVAAKDARILELEQKLTVAVATVDAATNNGCTAEERRELIELHFQLGRDLERCCKELRTLNAEDGQSLTDAQTGMATLQTSLDAAERALSRAQAEVVRLTEIKAELTRQKTDFGKRPVAGPGVLTAADVMAMIEASPRPEARSEAVTPMETDGGPRGSTSADLYHGCGNGRALAKHLTEYADKLLLSRDDADLAAAQQVIGDLRDHLTRLFRSNQLRRIANWMDDMPECIDDIYNRNDALKGTKALATHCPAAPANDSKLNEKLPRPADRRLRTVGLTHGQNTTRVVSDYVSSEYDIAYHPVSPPTGDACQTDHGSRSTGGSSDGAPSDACDDATCDTSDGAAGSCPISYKARAKLPLDAPSPTRHSRGHAEDSPYSNE
eukprot:gene27148-biopygen901